MADGQQLNEHQPKEQRHQSLLEKSKQWFLTVGTIIAVVGTGIGFLSDSMGLWEYLSEIGATSTPVVVAVEVRNLKGEVETPAPVETPTLAATSSPTLTPSPTPIPVVAAPNERLLIVAQFSNYTVDASYNVAGRIQEALATQVKAAKLEDTRVVIWPEAVEDNEQAVEVVGQTEAALVIWGEYDSGRVRVRFTLADGGADLDWQQMLGAPTELSTTINLDVPREAQALALMTLGRLYRNAGDLVRARSAFAQALAQMPSNVDTAATLTFYLAFMDASATPPALDAAIEGYTQVVEMRPEWLNARYNRGLAYLTRYWMTAEMDNLDAAIEDFTWTLEVRSDHADAHINRAIAYYGRNLEGDMDAALDDLTQVIERDPKSYRAYYNRGLAHIRLDKQEEWVADLEEALRIAPTFWTAHHALCWGYALGAMPEEGLAHCDAAVEQDSSGSMREGRGLVLAQLGRLDEAADDLELYVAWLETQPEVWSELNSQHIYEDLIASLRAGENSITPELLEQLR